LYLIELKRPRKREKHPIDDEIKRTETSTRQATKHTIWTSRGDAMPWEEGGSFFDFGLEARAGDFMGVVTVTWGGLLGMSWLGELGLSFDKPRCLLAKCKRPGF
jgi:hypothetical protein